MNRIGASRLQHISEILQVPVAFFFENAPDMPELRSSRKIATEPLDFVMEVISTKEGLALAKAFMRIINIQVRRRIVDLVEEIAAEKLH